MSRKKSPGSRRSLFPEKPFLCNTHISCCSMETIPKQTVWFQYKWGVLFLLLSCVRLVVVFGVINILPRILFSSLIYRKWMFRWCWDDWGSRGCLWFRPLLSTSLSTKCSSSSCRTPDSFNLQRCGSDWTFLTRKGHSFSSMSYSSICI